MLELYHNNVSVCAQKVRLVLAEKDLEWVGHHIDLKKGEQADAAYLAVNPKGLVPALVHDGRVITESTIICEYLDDAFPAPPLRPADPFGRSVMRRWAKIPDDGIHVACGSISFAGVFARQLAEGLSREALEARLAKMPDPARAARQRQIFEHGFDVPFVRDAIFLHAKLLNDIETQLADTPWLDGEDYSLAEACLTPYIERLDRLGLAPMWRDKPRLTDWFDRIRARPSFAAAFTAFEPVDYDDLLRDRNEGVWAQVAPILDAA